MAKEKSGAYHYVLRSGKWLLNARILESHNLNLNLAVLSRHAWDGQRHTRVCRRKVIHNSAG